MEFRMKSAHHRLVYLALLLVCMFCAASQVRTFNSTTRAASLKTADAATKARVNRDGKSLAGKGEVDLEVMVDGRMANKTRVNIK
jgi:hypothetical protein